MAMQPMVSPDIPALKNPPPRFHLLAKPSGSTCNLDCTYCFFLSKEALYPNSKSRMSEATLEAYIRQLLESHTTPSVTVAWQGGEPTLMGLDFFRRSVEFVDRYRRPGQEIEYTFQAPCLTGTDNDENVVSAPGIVHSLHRQRASLVRRSITRWYHESEFQADLDSLRYRYLLPRARRTESF